jgi:hypothetical protein
MTINAICLNNDGIEELEIGEVYEIELVIDKITNKEGWLVTIKDLSSSKYLLIMTIR